MSEQVAGEGAAKEVRCSCGNVAVRIKRDNSYYCVMCMRDVDKNERIERVPY